jgi:hypothetical protein
MHWVKDVAPEVQAESHFRSIIGVCISLTLTMLVFVATRLHVKLRVTKSPGISDVITTINAVSGLENICSITTNSYR